MAGVGLEGFHRGGYGHPLRLGQGESIDGYVSLSSVGAIEIYWRHAPAQYGGDAAIVLWTGRFCGRPCGTRPAGVL